MLAYRTLNLHAPSHLGPRNASPSPCYPPPLGTTPYVREWGTVETLLHVLQSAACAFRVRQVKRVHPHHPPQSPIPNMQYALYPHSPHTLLSCIRAVSMRPCHPVQLLSRVPANTHPVSICMQEVGKHTHYFTRSFAWAWHRMKPWNDGILDLTAWGYTVSRQMSNGRWG